MNYGGWNQASRTAFMAWVGTVFANSAGTIKDHGNNWGDWGTLGAVASAGVRHDTAAVLAEVERIKARIANDIDASGELPEENKRTNSGMWYTFFALTSMTTAAQIALNVTGVDLLAYTAPNGRTIKLALDKEFFYAMHPDQWPYRWPTGVAGELGTALPLRRRRRAADANGWPGNLFEIMSDVYKVQRGRTTSRLTGRSTATTAGSTRRSRDARRERRESCNAGSMARNPPLLSKTMAVNRSSSGRTPAGCGCRRASGIELPRQRAMRLILLALVRERLTRPGHALSWERLLAHGWPDERVMHDAGYVRVRVALSKLRALGLRGLITSRDDGYLLRDDAPVVLEGMGRQAGAAHDQPG